MLYYFVSSNFITTAGLLQSLPAEPVIAQLKLHMNDNFDKFLFPEMGYGLEEEDLKTFHGNPIEKTINIWVFP